MVIQSGTSINFRLEGKKTSSPQSKYLDYSIGIDIVSYNKRLGVYVDIKFLYSRHRNTLLCIDMSIYRSIYISIYLYVYLSSLSLSLSLSVSLSLSLSVSLSLSIYMYGYNSRFVLHSFLIWEVIILVSVHYSFLIA